jgi:hypothetical protein
MFDCDEFIESMTMFLDDKDQMELRKEHADACEDCRRIEAGVRSKEPVKPNPRVREAVLAYAAELAKSRQAAAPVPAPAPAPAAVPAPAPAPAPTRLRTVEAVLLLVAFLLVLAVGFALGRAIPGDPEGEHLPPRERIMGPPPGSPR